MFSIEIWYLWCIQYVLPNSYTIIYTKFIYISCKFYSVRSFEYSWNDNDYILHLSHSLVNISTTNIDKVVSMLFSQTWTNANKQTSAQLSFWTKFQRLNNIVSSALNQRNSCFANVKTMSINVRRCVCLVMFSTKSN